ncbi:MAG TPA: 23S rRNA (guanosine(2251)-2'-O)-methyltransferase RlmB [Bacteroidia bacterium]|jgi:23S rRNA (guanosine2251-2'-O)-methyltransferase|nr:23S rRNA (guanosine(2251)-2'-O)-methyltransferase RlmB [Bacteroidia bacterium]
MSYYREKQSVDTTNMIFGARAVIEAIEAGKEIDRLYLQSDLNNELMIEVRRAAKSAGVVWQFVPEGKFNRIAPGKNHQGVVAFITSVEFHKLDNLLPQIFERGEMPLILILDRITDVRNFGAIARSAECAGVHAIVIPSRGAAQVNGDAVKTSAGALNIIPVCREENLKDVIEFLKNSGLRIASCTEKAESEYYSADLTGPLAVIMGSEEDGISSEYLKRSDVRVQIPMHGKISSLNVSVATGIILFEVLRQRK